MKVRPSEVYGFTDLEAYAFDSAVTKWGLSFEAAVEEAVASAKDDRSRERARDRVIRRWLPSTRKYADPNEARL